MKSLNECVAELTDLIQRNQTLEAMQRFYAEGVTMQENKAPPRVGKAACLEHERRMIARTTSMQARLVNQAVDYAHGIVFGEWVYTFTDLSGQRFSLSEISVQHWQNELIYREKFYYHKILT